MFYQKHCAAPEAAVGSGPIWGHMVSDDQLRWRRLPAALWNGLNNGHGRSDHCSISFRYTSSAVSYDRNRASG
jgi:sucrose-6-phosphate hydrolase SacC (GH32 family)